MVRLTSLFDQSSGNHPDARFRRLLFRSWHRGTQENDLLLGSFAELYLPCFDAAQLDRYEILLDCTDPDLFDWILRGSEPPALHNHDVMRLLRNYCAAPHLAPEHNVN